MTCPITGKPCLKHKAYTVTEKKGSEQNSYAVCEDCMHLNDSLSFEDEFGPCPGCGETLESIVKSSRIGCARCYDHFDEPLSHMIAAVQACAGAKNKHVGSVPDSYKRSVAESKTAVRFATELIQKIRTAQKDERYEEAARLNSTLARVREFISRADEKGQLESDDRVELSRIVYDYMFSASTEGV